MSYCWSLWYYKIPRISITVELRTPLSTKPFDRIISFTRNTNLPYSALPSFPFVVLSLFLYLVDGVKTALYYFLVDGVRIHHPSCAQPPAPPAPSRRRARSHCTSGSQRAAACARTASLRSNKTRQNKTKSYYDSVTHTVEISATQL